MIGEIWTYEAVKPNDGETKIRPIKIRPILIIGDDANNQLQYVDIHYVIISSSSDCGVYDVMIEEETALNIGLQKKSIIKTTKIYTGAKSKLGVKIGELPINKKEEFIKKYRSYQENIMSKFFIEV